MVIGNRKRFGIELLPLAPGWDRRYSPEVAAWARFSVWVDGVNLCRNVVEGSDAIRDGVNVPLAPIADWIVRAWTPLQFEERPELFPPGVSTVETLRAWGNSSPLPDLGEDDWFDTRERWWSRHFLLAGADGAQLPNVSFVRSGEELVVEWAPSEFAGARAPSFLAGTGQGTVAWTDAYDVLAELVARVAQWLREARANDAYEWAALSDPLREVRVDFLGTLEAYTGRSSMTLRSWTGTESEAALRASLGIPDQCDDPGASVITQILRDVGPVVSGSVREQIWRTDALSGHGCGVDEPLRETARDAARAGGTPEEAGQLAAREVRDRLALDSQPIDDVDAVARDVGLEAVDSTIPGGRERMFVGAREGLGAAAVINRTPRTETPWGRRFELARALGHVLLGIYRGAALGAASSDFAQPRARRRSGAFAAELLVPASALHDASNGALDACAEPGRFELILRRYNVGARTAAFQLWNHGLLSSPHVRDELIDRFSSLGAGS